MEKVKLSEPKASLYPVPVTLLTCSDGIRTNIITVSWTGILSSSPPIIYVSIRPERFSYHLLEIFNKFCLNIPSEENLQQVDFCGNNTGELKDKSKECNFSLIDLQDEYPKAIENCKHNLFCDITQKIEFGSHTAFISIIKYEYIDVDISNGDHEFFYEKIKPIAYCRKRYYSIGNYLGDYGFTKKNIKEF